MNAVDTNVFVYALYDHEAVKQAKAREVLNRLVQPPLATVLRWKVAGDFLSCLRKMGIGRSYHDCRYRGAFPRPLFDVSAAHS